MSQRSRAFGWIVTAYLTALVVAILSGWWAVQLGWSRLAVAALADGAATLTVFAFSVAFRNSSFYDAYWSVAPPLILAYWALSAEAVDPLRLLCVSLVVLAWAVRLTANWARGWQGLQHEDWRYVDLQQQTGSAYWLVSLLGLHGMPTALVFFACLPLLAVSESGVGFNYLDVLALAVGLAAVVLEWRADEALIRFRRERADASQLLTLGPWAWCRHPNYLGEIGFWFSLMLFGLAAGGGIVFVGFGFLLMVGLFVGVTIPMIERRHAERKPAYAEYRQSTSMLLPRLPKPGKA